MKRLHRPLATLLMFGLVTAACADDLTTAGDSESLGFSMSRLARIATWYQEANVDQVPGAVVAIAKDGKLAYLKATGFQDRDKKIPMKPDSIFLIGSMTKQVTAVAAMMLVDEGRLDLDAPVSQYLPDLKDMQVFSFKNDPATGFPIIARQPQKRPMTIRDLLRQTSGLIYPELVFGDSSIENTAVHFRYVELIGGSTAVFNRDRTLADFVAGLGKLPLAHQPGEVWEYAMGFDVLGRVIEVASSQPFDQFLESHLFKPLHMVDTGFDVPEAKLARLVDPLTPKRPPLWDVTRPARLFSGGGGLVSTAVDYVRFCQMLLNGGELDGARILKSETVHLMTTNSLSPDIHLIGNLVGPDLGTGWGLGFAVRTDANFSQVPGSVGSFGWQGSWGTHFWIDPAERLIAVVLTQAAGREFSYFNGVRQLVYGALRIPEQSPLPSQTASGLTSVTGLGDYAGKYTFGSSTSARDMRGWASGGAGQVGIEAVAMEEDGLRVVRLTDDGPAATAGVVAGDLVTRIDGASVKGLVLEQAFGKTPGAAGKKIRLEVMREGEVSPLVITVTRGPILSRAVALEVRVKDDKLVVTSIGQWPILDFEKNVPVTVVLSSNNEFFVNGGDHTRIAFLSERGGKATGVVLNPGPWQIAGKRIN